METRWDKVTICFCASNWLVHVCKLGADNCNGEKLTDKRKLLFLFQNGLVA